MREFVAIGALGAALVLGFLFLDPAASESNANGTPVAAPQSWHISFFDARTTPATESGSGDSPGLDLAFKGAPFVDFKDNAWYVLASAEVQTAGGYASITFEHTCDLEVVVDGHDVVRVPHNGKLQTTVAKFTHAAGPVRILVQCHDGDGEFTLKYVG
jgi:hypothetical protein